MNPLPPDLAECADEPIRVPGAVQPHGWMMVLRASDFAVRALSDNAPPRQRLQPLLEALVPRLQGLADGEAPAVLGVLSVDGAPCDAAAHRSGDSVIVEFEPATPDLAMRAPIYTLARSFLPHLQHADTLQELAELAVVEMKRLTGFGRCLLYRFDADDHGEVIAERADAGYESYAGHRFPATDIPAQARELYRLNHIRLIGDARYVPVGLSAVEPGFDPRRLDMSFAALRSVSPVHLEYMRNMGTLASMSVSIVVRGRLWGLISCHDHDPRHVALPVRLACEHLGRLLSLQIEAKEDNAEVATRAELRQLTLDIVSHLSDSDATLQQLIAEPAPLLRLARATGAAVVLNDECWTVGDVPDHAHIQAVARWVAAQGVDVLHSDRLSEQAPELDMPLQHSAGVLAISISQVHRHLLLWFRPELVQTIQWAGDPRKQVRDGDGRLHPRRSFASWKEQVRGRSLPWSFSEVSAVLELRQALIGIVLRRAEEMAEVAAELGRVNKELEAFSYTVSHDLRAPMRHIAGYVDLVLDTDGAQLGERSRRYLGNVKDAAAFAGQLVDALLDFSRLGRSALARSDVDTEAMVDDLIAELRAHEAARAVRWEVERPLPRVWADPFLLQVAVRNLLSNAVKYSRGRQPPVVRVRGLRQPEGVGLEVSDNGVGFQQKYVAKLFGVFQRLHQAEEFEGTGIGLANVRRIVERHGGIVWANGVVNEGATFGFVVPRRDQSPSPSQES